MPQSGPRTRSSLNSPNSSIGLFYADSGFFDGNIRFFCRIGSKPFLWWILKTWEKARYRNVIEPLCISRVRFGALLVWNSCASISCGKVSERPNPFIFNLACNLVWNFVRDLARNLVWNFCRKARIVAFLLSHAEFSYTGADNSFELREHPGYRPGSPGQNSESVETDQEIYYCSTLSMIEA
jgi:hypothetical protein